MTRIDFGFRISDFGFQNRWNLCMDVFNSEIRNPKSEIQGMLFLIGLRGSGKTTVGRILAERLALPFRDADVELESHAGRSIRDIFAVDGETAFRDLEERNLIELIDLGPAVIATGGGVVLREANRVRMKNAGKVVWLTADAGAVGADAGRSDDGGTAAESGGRRGSGSRRIDADSGDPLSLDRGSDDRNGGPLAGTDCGRYFRIMLNFVVANGPAVYFGLVAFVIGAMLGSLMNVVVARMVFEKSIFWPGSRCGNCYQPIRLLFDNIPLFSYVMLRGRCRTCKARYSIRYFLIELFIALAFVGIFVVEILHNVNGVPGLAHADHDLNFRFVSLSNLPYLMFFLHRAILLWFLAAAALCDLQDAGGDHVIPFSIPLTGTIIGLVFSVFCPWPWPSTPEQRCRISTSISLAITVGGWCRRTTWKKAGCNSGRSGDRCRVSHRPVRGSSAC